MKYLCLRNCFINGQIYLKGETHELPDSMKESTKFQPVGGEPDPTEKAPEPVHKHYYHKDGTCRCGAKLSAGRMKAREAKTGRKHLKHKE